MARKPISRKDINGGGGNKAVDISASGFKNPGPTRNLRGIEANTARQSGGKVPPLSGITAKDER